MDGVINVLKPPGMTSSNVVVYVRKLLRLKKVGHTGTLDPAATGVLPLCVGKATKLVEYIMDHRKTYRGEMVLGIETDTLDAEGQVTTKTDKLPVQADIEKVFKKYQGKILQTPPMYSAIKHKGKRLYELAREGVQVDIRPREVQIFKNKILDIKQDRILFEVECSKGTYIRSLCYDIGKELGCGAHLSFLLRTTSGIFSVQNSHTLDEIKNTQSQGSLSNLLIPMDRAISDFNAVYLTDNSFSRVTNGNDIGVDAILSDVENIYPTEMIRVYCRGHFIGIGLIHENSVLQMKKVLL